MKLLVCTANQPRHVTLVKRLVQAGHDVVTIVEPKSYLEPENATLKAYWAHVREAEDTLFGSAYAMPRVPVIALRPGELSKVPSVVGAALSDRFPVVFSSSYITGDVLQWFLERGALNLHVGIAPEYRGSAPNMWAHYNGRPDFIGAQVQRLAKSLDGGDILKEVRPPLDFGNYFQRSMFAVKLGIDAVLELLATPEPWLPVRPNERSLELSYTRHEAFTEQVARQILETA
jgi:methionyl-tRNA formyltransferase